LFIGGVVGRSAARTGDDDIASSASQFHCNWPANGTHAPGTSDDGDVAG
jgi:hypothetical protein